MFALWVTYTPCSSSHPPKILGKHLALSLYSVGKEPKIDTEILQRLHSSGGPNFDKFEPKFVQLNHTVSCYAHLPLWEALLCVWNGGLGLASPIMQVPSKVRHPGSGPLG